MATKIEYRICEIPDCGRKTSKMVCRYHTKKHFKLSKCTNQNCQNMARGPLCFRHTPEAREYNRIKVAEWHAARRHRNDAL
jgi:hypothetical protein